MYLNIHRLQIYLMFSKSVSCGSYEKEIFLYVMVFCAVLVNSRIMYAYIYIHECTVGLPMSESSILRIFGFDARKVAKLCGTKFYSFRKAFRLIVFKLIEYYERCMGDKRWCFVYFLFRNKNINIYFYTQHVFLNVSIREKF